MTVFAQSLLEYTSLSSAITGAFRSFGNALVNMADDWSQQTWLIIGGIFALTLLLFRRRNRRRL